MQTWTFVNFGSRTDSAQPAAGVIWSSGSIGNASTRPLARWNGPDQSDTGDFWYGHMPAPWCCSKNGVPWIPSRKNPFLLALTYQHRGLHFLYGHFWVVKKDHGMLRYGYFLRSQLGSNELPMKFIPLGWFSRIPFSLGKTSIDIHWIGIFSWYTILMISWMLLADF